jgi:hypothetical protein
MSAGPYRNQRIHWHPARAVRLACGEPIGRRRSATDAESFGANPPLTREDVNCPGCLVAMNASSVPTT